MLTLTRTLLSDANFEFIVFLKSNMSFLFNNLNLISNKFFNKYRNSIDYSIADGILSLYRSINEHEKKQE